MIGNTGKLPSIFTSSLKKNSKKNNNTHVPIMIVFKVIFKLTGNCIQNIY